MRAGNPEPAAGAPTSTDATMAAAAVTQANRDI